MLYLPRSSNLTVPATFPRPEQPQGPEPTEPDGPQDPWTPVDPEDPAAPEPGDFVDPFDPDFYPEGTAGLTPGNSAETPAGEDSFSGAEAAGGSIIVEISPGKTHKQFIALVAASAQLQKIAGGIMVAYFLLVFAVAFLLTLVLTPLVIRLAYRVGAIDIPNKRKVHNRIMPRLGGLAVYLGFLAAVLVVVNYTYDRQILGLLLGGTVVLLVGVVDDIKSLPPLAKLLGQVLAAAIPVYFGIRVNFINNPFDGYFHLGWMSIPVTMLWIVGITNAINLIDGLDGLASGVSFIALLIFSFMSLQVNQNTLIALVPALAGRF